MRQKHPRVPMATYVNSSAAVKAESDACCTAANAEEIVESLGSDTVILLQDEYLAQNVAAQTRVKITAWAGHCEVHERFTGAQVRALRSDYPGVAILAHPESRPEVIAEAGYTGSTADMSNSVGRGEPARVVLLSVCSMADNVSVHYPSAGFVRPCNLWPHMRHITLANIRTALEEMRHEMLIGLAIAARARQSVERMLAVR